MDPSFITYIILQYLLTGTSPVLCSVTKLRGAVNGNLNLYH